MKKLLILTFLITCFQMTGQAQQIRWERQWTGNLPQSFIASVDKNQDTSIIASGGTYQFNSGPFNSFFIKYNKNGILQWQKYGRQMRSGEQDIKPFFNSKGYIFAGTGKGTGFSSDILLHRLSSTGDTIWSKRYGSNSSGDYPIKLFLNNDSTFLAGSTEVYKSTGISLCYFFQKLDSAGNQQLFKVYDKGRRNDYASYLIQNNRGNYVIAGISQGHSSGYFHPYLLEVNPNGDSINGNYVFVQGNAFQKEYNYRMYNNLAEISNGGYIFSGYLEGTPNNTIYYFICKVDALFNRLWTYVGFGQALGLPFTKVQQLSDGSFAILANGIPTEPGSYHIIKVSSTGQFISKTTYTSSLAPQVTMYSWTFLGDGSAVVAGRGSNNLAYIARINNVGVPATITAVSEPIAKEVKLGQSYPNPAATEVTIPYWVRSGVKDAEMRLQEVATGRVVQVVKLPASQNQANLNLQVVEPGVYSYTLLEDGLPVATKKLVVVK